MGNNEDSSLLDKTKPRAVTPGDGGETPNIDAAIATIREFGLQPAPLTASDPRLLVVGLLVPFAQG